MSQAVTDIRKRKVMLQDGNRDIRAISRTSNDIKDTPGGGFVDSYVSELAAYEPALLQRRRILVDAVAGQIQTQGADNLLFD